LTRIVEDAGREPLHDPEEPDDQARGDDRRENLDGRMQHAGDLLTVEEVPHALTIHHQKQALVRRLRLTGEENRAPAQTITVLGRRLPELAATAEPRNQIIATRRTDSKGRLSLSGLNQLGWAPGPLCVRTAGQWIELAPTEAAPARNCCRLLDKDRLTVSTAVRRQIGDEVLVVIDPDTKKLYLAAPSVVLSLINTPEHEEHLSA
jgi:hypothetical protein